MADWAKLKVVDLKAELKRRDLNVNGLKADLVGRLEEDDLAQGGGAAANGQDANKTEVKEAEAEHEEPADGPAVETIKNEVAEVEQEAAASATEPQVTVTEGDNVGEKDDHSAASEPPAQDATRPVSVDAAEGDTSTPQPMHIEETANEPKSEPQSVTPAADTQTPELAVALPVSTTTSPPPDSQKRKRRSQSPPPVEDDVARKRARADSDAGPNNGILAESDNAIMSDAPPRSPLRDGSKRSDAEHRDDEMDFERDVAPARHPATSALYINNLMRPLRPEALRSHLASLASRSSSSPSDEVVATFFLDQIRTHAFVVFDSISSASRVRTALHDRVWPEESNRKALAVDFVPPEKVPEWIEREENEGKGARTGSRWEVVYETLPSGDVEAYLESGAISGARSGPPPATGRAGPPPPASGTHGFDSTNSIPLGPRGFRDDAGLPPPTGPRSSREQFQQPPLSSRPPPAGSLMTRAYPSIAYQPVSRDLANRRLSSMQSHYTQDTRRPLGREINRYYFEDGDRFVDRGKEVFEGIRPPHRERGGGGGGGGFRGRGRGGGGGGGGFGGFDGGRRRGGRGGGRGRGDRYLPPGRGRAGEDDGRLPRYPDDR